MTDKVLKLALALVLAAVAMKFAMFAQSPATSNASLGAVQVLDGNNHVLGTLLGLGPVLNSVAAPQQPNSFIVYRNGWFVTLLFGGRFPLGLEKGTFLYWSGPNCTGSPYLPAGSEPISRRLVIYSTAANSLYRASGSGELALPATPAQQFHSVEIPNGGCGNGVYGGFSTWQLEPFDANRLGWELSGNPMRVTGPVTFKQF